MRRHLTILPFAVTILCTCKNKDPNSLELKNTSITPVDFSDENCSLPEETSKPIVTPHCKSEAKAMKDYLSIEDSKVFNIVNDLESHIAQYLKHLNDQMHKNKEKFESAGDQDNEKVIEMKKFIADQVSSLSSTITEYRNTPADRKGKCESQANEDLQNETPIECQSFMDQLVLGKCINFESLNFKGNQPFANGMCSFYALREKISTMRKLRADGFNLRLEEGEDPPSNYEISVGPYLAMMDDIKGSIDSQIHRLESRITNLEKNIQNGSFQALGAKSLPYLSMVFSPDFSSDNLSKSIVNLEESIKAYNQNVLDIYQEEKSKGNLKASIKNFALRKINNEISFSDIDSVEEANNLEIKNLEAEKANILQELENSQKRIGTSIDRLRTVNDPKDIRVALIFDKGNEENPFPDAIQDRTFEDLERYSSNIEGGRNIYHVVVESSPNMVVNGIYYKTSAYIKNLQDFLAKEPHLKWKTAGFTTRQIITLSQKPADPFDRNYGHRAFLHFYRNSGIILRNKMRTGGLNVYRHYTQGFDGYILSRSEGTSSSTSKSPDPPSSKGSVLGAIAGAYVGAVVGGPAGAAQGYGLGQSLGSLFDRANQKSYKSESKSFSQGYSFRTGYYSIFSKYPDIRVGRLVAELGCNGNYNRYNRPNIDKYGMIDTKDDSPLLTAPVEGADPRNFRFPAGENEFITVNVPENCKKPTLRLTVNDSDLGRFEGNCLTGPSNTGTEHKPSEDILVNGDQNKQCSYTDGEYRIRVYNIKNLDAEIKLAVGLLFSEDGPLGENSTESALYENIAFGANPYRATIDAINQYLAQKGVTKEAIEKIRPLISNFVSTKLNQKKISDITHKIEKIAIENKGIETKKQKLVDKTGIYDSIQTLNETLVSDAKIFESLFKARSDIYHSAIIHNLRRVSNWGELFFAGMEYHEYQISNSDESIGGNGVTIESNRVKMRTLIAGIKKRLSSLYGEGDLVDRHAKVMSKNTSDLQELKRLATFNNELIKARDQLIQNKVGHCHISMYHYLRDQEGNSIFGEDVTLENNPFVNTPPNENNKKYLFKREISPTAPSRAYYSIPFDLGDLYRRSPNKANAWNCTLNFDENGTPKILGMALELLGSGVDSSYKANTKNSLTRDSTMYWYNKQGQRYFRNLTIDGFIESDALGSIKLSRNKPAIRTIFSTQRANSCSGDYAEANCMKAILGTNNLLGSDLGNGKSFSFNVIEYNALLGGNWEIVISDETEKVEFENSSNLILHVYYYIPGLNASLPTE